MLLNIEKDEINNLPLLRYEGEVVFIDSDEKIGCSIEEILSEQIIGIDTETKPAFKKGVHYNVALLQIATAEKVYLFRLNLLNNMNLFQPIFEEENILKIGIGLKDDIRELKLLLDFNAKGFLDLNEELPKFGFEKIGMKNLSAMILGHRISKKQQISDWEKEELTPAQINYAATDAYVSRLLYIKLLEEDIAI